MWSVHLIKVFLVSVLKPLQSTPVGTLLLKEKRPFVLYMQLNEFSQVPNQQFSYRDRKSTRLKLQSRGHLVCRLLLEKKNKTKKNNVEYMLKSKYLIITIMTI